MTLRQDKVSSLIKNMAADFLRGESGKISLITVIKAEVSKDLKKSTIYVTIFPEDKEVAALDFLKRRRADFRDYFKKSKVNMKTIPFFDFEIDAGEKNRQRIDELSRE